MSENGDLRQDGTFLPLPLPRQFSHEGRRGSLGKFFSEKSPFSNDMFSYGESEKIIVSLYDK